MITHRVSHTIRLGLRSLAAHRLRSALTILGIVLGVASVIVMLAVGEAARYEALQQLRDLGANTLLLHSVKPQDEPDRSQGLDMLAYGLTRADLERIVRTVPTVVSATPMREFRKDLRYRDKKLEARVVSVTPDFFRQYNLTLSRGRGVTDHDERTFANVAVLGAAAAESLFPYSDPIGRSITIDDVEGAKSYSVVGVTESKTLAAGGGAGAGVAIDFNRVAFIPFATDRLRFGLELISWKTGSFQIERLEISQITVTVDEVTNVPRTAAVVQGLLDQFHPRNDVSVFIPLDLLEKAERTQRLFTLVLGAIASISLVVGGIGIMNIMLATVIERTKEIGIRRALGAKRRDIALQFLIETILLSSTGGLLGVGLGIGMARTVTHFCAFPT